MKSLRSRIKSVDSTLHLTKAMGLVASSKIRRATINMNQGREYAAAVNDVIGALIDSPECAKCPYLTDHTSQENELRTHLIVIAGDRGLAGGYNANVFRLARQHLGEGVSVSPIGKRACDRFGAGAASAEKYTLTQANELAARLCDGFAAGEYDRVGIIWTKYISMMTQEATLTWLLPLRREEIMRTEGKMRAGMIFEPDELTILNLAVREFVAGRIAAAVRESFASEVAARRCAMDSAGKNAQQMIDELQLEYNRARQGAITQELTEIVAGANA
ncbi:MAG: ATP synthase F1 subunit gamma [Clostridia bacterium]|nr:ATP synthase F1 subunit gamma [Clostridia bacterium]MBQ7339184.1 ATP synthase F1 subunit gamma [Clostridia bacterium]